MVNGKGEGKSRAVDIGVKNSDGFFCIILDADLTVRMEDVNLFYSSISIGNGDLINGSRLIYKLNKGSMRLLNFFGNKFFSILVSYIVSSNVTDTLCGTKVLSKTNFKKIEKSFKYFGNFDPFGDFLLIFGAIKENLKIVELPIKYKKRVYGRTQISRFKHGFMLLKMVIFSYFKIKAI